MGNGNCAVIGCHNNSKKLKHWKESICDIKEHESKIKESCGCEAPFRLYMFPSIKRNGKKREAWIKSLKRQNINKTSWQPCSSDRVCDEHFLDGIPTEQNPDPTNLEIRLQQKYPNSSKTTKASNIGRKD